MAIKALRFLYLDPQAILHAHDNPNIRFSPAIILSVDVHV